MMPIGLSVACQIESPMAAHHIRKEGDACCALVPQFCSLRTRSCHSSSGSFEIGEKKARLVRVWQVGQPSWSFNCLWSSFSLTSHRNWRLLAIKGLLRSGGPALYEVSRTWDTTKWPERSSKSNPTMILGWLGNTKALSGRRL